MNIVDYTTAHTTQAAEGINMEFFKVAIVGDPTKDEYLRLIAEHGGEHCRCDLTDGKEHSYLEVGGWIGDQGLAMQCMALGVHLGVFKLLTPSTMLPFLDENTKQMLAGQGMVCVQRAA